MAEYIERDKAVEKITAYCELRQAICINDKDEFLRGLQTALKAISYNDVIPNADVQPVNQWISCKDKMPEHGVTVLIYTGNHTISLAWYDKVMEFFYICDSDYKYNPLDVTHWRPLPEPPKEG